MIRVLHVVTTMDLGGVETLLMNLYRNIDRDKVQFDFLCMNTCENYFSKEIKSLGGRMFAIPFISKAGYFGYKKNLFEFFNAHPEYQIIHTHIYAYNGLVLEAAKKAGIQVRIEHSHAVYSKNKNIAIRIINELGKRKIEKNATAYFSCSEDARDSFYINQNNRDECIVLKNVINVDNFSYRDKDRVDIRTVNNAQDAFVIGQVGRFDLNKNQLFSISVFEKFHKDKPNSQLWFIGDGPQLQTIKEYVEQNNLEDSVLFLGLQNDVCKYMCGMDVLLFPSKKEGFGIVTIEAQANGLPVIASDAVPKETQLTALIDYISLDNEKTWIKRLKDISNNETKDRKAHAGVIRNSGYDVKAVAEELQCFYINKYN